MKKDNSTMFDYGCFYKEGDKIVRVCGSAHPISGGEDVILFSYVDKYITSDVYYCTKEEFAKKFVPTSKY